MDILDAGHIYRVAGKYGHHAQYLKFVKRSGGAVTYQKEWPGIQTQAVMRAVIQFILFMQMDEEGESQTYSLWQLGSDHSQILTLHGVGDTQDVLDILSDRSRYLNNIINCTETMDAVYWLGAAKSVLDDPDYDFHDRMMEAAHGVRMALWCYEARAYRRKQEGVNRKQPEHDDSARLRPWRHHPADDVPFGDDEIELIPIGPDGHILLEERHG